jgi:uncharacterized membrane protein
MLPNGNDPSVISQEEPVVVALVKPCVHTAYLQFAVERAWQRAMHCVKDITFTLASPPDRSG